MRFGSALGVFVMVATAATIVAVAGQIMATALGAPGAGRFAAADVVVRANPTVRFGHGDDPDTLEVRRPALLPTAARGRVAALPGVRSAVGDVAFPLTVVGRDEAPLPTEGGTPAHGHGWPSADLTPYRLLRGRAPALPGEVVLDAGLARSGGFPLGGLVRVVTPVGPEAFRLSGVVSAARSQQERQSSVFFTQARAQQLSGLGAGFDAIAVRSGPGVDQGRLRDRIHSVVGNSVQVLEHRHASAADAGDPRAFDRVQLVAVVASGGGLTVLITVFVVAGTIAFAVARRRRELALLRAVGATPGQARRLLLRQIGLIGLLAGAVGCAVARLLFVPAANALASVGLAPDGFTLAPNWIPYAVAVAAGVVVSLLATVIAARRALAVRPGEAMVESDQPPRRLSAVRVLAGLVALGGGTTLVVVLSSSALSYATLSAFLFMTGVALLGPLVLGWPSALAGRLLLRGGGTGFLAGSALVTGRFRTGAVGAAIALVVALAGTQVLELATAQRAVERAAADRVLADRVLVARTGGGLPSSVAETVANLPDAAAAGVVSTDVFLLDHGLTRHGSSWDAAGVDATPGTLDLDVRAGSLAAVTGDGVAVSDTVARAGDLAVGSTLDARLADATPARLRVVAVYTRANGLGDVVLPHALALAHAAEPLDSAVFVAGGGARLDRELAGVARATPTVGVLSRSGYLREVKAEERDNARAQWVIVALMIGVAIMAALNTGAMAAAERRGELVLARLTGASRIQVAGALTLEALVTALVGIAVGVAVALGSLLHAPDDPEGGPLAVAWPSFGLVLAGALALGLVGMLVPAALVGRAPITAHAGLRDS
ncbi:MAG TPA: FtsX-like permease family protein [Gaiella sp.]|jgi:putative ABC transport system permease protein